MRRSEQLGVLLGLGTLVVGGVAWASSERASQRQPGAAPPPSPASGFGPPVAPPLRTTPHGYYQAPRLVDGKFDHAHQGVDLAAKPGSPVWAIGTGLVVAIENPGNCQTGVKIYLDGVPGRSVVYCDLGTADVAPGTHVEKGGVIGHIGSRGFVHVAIRLGLTGAYVDPSSLLSVVA